jgi:hypothetical protein
VLLHLVFGNLDVLLNCYIGLRPCGVADRGVIMLLYVICQLSMSVVVCIDFRVLILSFDDTIENLDIVFRSSLFYARSQKIVGIF